MKVFTIARVLRFFTAGGRGGGKRDCKAKEGQEEAQIISDLPSGLHNCKEETQRPIAIDESPRLRGQKDERLEEGPWAGLLREALAEVFDRLPFEDRLRTVPLVCKDWRSAALSPMAWRNVDMGPWMTARAEESYDWQTEVDMKGLVRLVVDRSAGQLVQLKTGYCTNEIVDYIAAKCPLLRQLSIRNSFVVDDGSANNLARSCCWLESLDLSECYNISAKGVEAFGVNCPALISFTRNMTEILFYDDVVPPRGDEEATAIATHMGSLKVLSMRRMATLTDSGLLQIASSCDQLEGLDLACCDALSPQGLDRAVSLCSKLRNFVRPIKARMHVDPKFMPGLYMVNY